MEVIIGRCYAWPSFVLNFKKNSPVPSSGHVIAKVNFLFLCMFLLNLTHRYLQRSQRADLQGSLEIRFRHPSLSIWEPLGISQRIFGDLWESPEDVWESLKIS